MITAGDEEDGWTLDDDRTSTSDLDRAAEIDMLYRGVGTLRDVPRSASTEHLSSPC